MYTIDDWVLILVAPVKQVCSSTCKLFIWCAIRTKMTRVILCLLGVIYCNKE